MHIHDIDQTVKSCLEFYNKLYRSSADKDSHDDPTTTSIIDPLSILPSEIETLIKNILKRNEPRGEDNIPGGILQEGGDAMIQAPTDLFYMSALLPCSNSTGKCSDCLNT